MPRNVQSEARTGLGGAWRSGSEPGDIAPPLLSKVLLSPPRVRYDWAPTRQGDTRSTRARTEEGSTPPGARTTLKSRPGSAATIAQMVHLSSQNLRRGCSGRQSACSGPAVSVRVRLDVPAPRARGRTYGVMYGSTGTVLPRGSGRPRNPGALKA